MSDYASSLFHFLNDYTAARATVLPRKQDAAVRMSSMDSQTLIGVHTYAATDQESNLLQMCCELENLVAESESRGFFSEPQRHSQRVYEAVVGALTIVGRDHKHATAECRRILVSTRSLCTLLWSSCRETEKVLSLRYTLVRRLLAVSDNRSCIEESWNLLEDLLCQPLNETFSTSRCQEVCLQNKDNKVFATILVGTVLNLIRLLAEKSDVSPTQTARDAIDEIVRLSNVVPPTIEVVFTLPGDSVQRHARSFVNCVMVLPIYSTEITSGSITTARQRFGFALLRCLNHVSFEKAHLVYICNKIVSMLTLSEFHKPLSQIICQKLSEQHDHERVSIYHQVALRAMQTREHSEVLTFLGSVSRVGEADSLFILMLRTTIILAMQVNQDALIKSLAQTNILVHENLLNCRISRHPSCFHVYGLLAREIQIFSQKQQQRRQAWSADVFHEIRNFSYSSLNLIERVANEGLVVQKACVILVEACLPTALSILLMELTAKDCHEVSTYAITLNMIQRLMSNTRINTISTRRIIHSFAKKYTELGLLDIAEKLYTINVDCLNSEEVEMFEEGERIARIKSLLKHLCQSGKYRAAVDILLNKSEQYGTGEVPLQLTLQMYTEMFREHGTHGPTTCSFVAHLIREYGCKNDYYKLLEDENECWCRMNTSVELRHRVQSSLLDAAVTLLKSNSEVVHTYNYVRVICNMLRLMRTFPKHGNSCARDSCKVCSHMAILRLYQEVEEQVERDNVPNGQILLLEFTCWITFALIDTGEDSAYERAHSLMENAIEVHNLTPTTPEVVSSSVNDFEQMCEAVQHVCEFFNLHGSTYYSGQFRAYLCGNSKSYVSSVLLAPVPSPCIFLAVRRGRPYRKCIQVCADYHQGQSMLTLGGILAERGDFNEAFSYIEIAVKAFKSSFYSAKLGNCFKDRSAVCHHRTSIFKVFGMYVTALCSKAIICAELGMVSYGLSAVDEALKLCAVVGVTRLQNAVRLRRAYVLTRFGELEKASNELSRCDTDVSNILLGSRTQLDEYTERYSRALLLLTESSCYRGAKKIETHERALSFACETMETTLKYTGLNCSCLSPARCTCPKDRVQLVTYWSSPWRSVRANLLYRDVANSSIEKRQSYAALCTLVSGTRHYQPLLLILLLLCELKMKHSINLHLDECLPCVSDSSSMNHMSRDMESILSRILWLVRDWPSLFCHLQKKLLSMALAGDLNSAALVSGLQTHCGAPIRSQCLAALTSKLLQRFESDHGFVYERNKLHCSQHVPYSLIRRHLRVSEYEINKLIGTNQHSGNCLEHTHLVFPVVTIGLVQKNHVDGGIPELIISRVCTARDSSVCIRFIDPSICEIFDCFSKLVQVQHNVPEPSSSRESKINWWEKRLQIDAGLRQILDEFSSSSLGAWRVLLLGDIIIEPMKQELRKLTTQVTSRMEDVALELNLYLSASASELIYVLLAGADFITDDEFCCALFSLLLPRDANVTQTEYHVIATHHGCSQQKPRCKISKVVQFLRQALATAAHSHKPYVDKESERGPVILVLGNRVNSFAWESLDVLKSQRVYRNPSMAVALTMAAHWSSAFKAKDIERSYFVLNPSGDLVKTQKVLEPLLLQTGWDGVAGSPPAPSKVLSALQKSDFYLYFGHGGGQDVLSTDVIRNADVDSVTLLMGCSSGAFDTSDTTSSVSISLSYLLAGAPAVIANLWDVTDGDIDRFSKELIQNWRSSSHSGAHICLSTSLQNARNVCQLKYLVGAAPVLFGIPTVIGISQ